MRKISTNDMTVGSPMRLLLSFSIPLFIGNIFQLLYNMVDTYIVGQIIDYKALAAVGATGAISFLILGFVQGLTAGFTVVTAQRFGAKDEKGVRNSIATSTILSVVFTIIITLISCFACRWLLEVMATPSDIIDNAYTYIIIIFGGMIFCVFYNLISGIIRALGDSKTPLIFLIVACILNIILDIILVGPVGMGVAGAAWATIIAQFLSGIACLIFALKKYPIMRLKKEDWKLDLAFTKEHLRIALPMAFQFSVTAIGVMVIQTALNRLGSDVIAGFTASCRIINIAEQPMNSLGVAIATFAAQNFGAGKMHRIKEGVRKCALLTTAISVVAGIALVIFGRGLIGFFIKEPTTAVMESALIYLVMASATMWILGLLFIYRNALQGIGSSFVPMMAGVSELVIRCVAAFTLAAPLGYFGVCLSDPLAWIGATIPLFIKYVIEIRKIDKEATRIDVAVDKKTANEIKDN